VVFGRGSTISPGMASAFAASNAPPAAAVPEPSGLAIVAVALAAGATRLRRVR
jgi:hypothetical protein